MFPKCKDFHLSPTTTIEVRCYYPYFLNKKNEAQRLSHLPQVAQLCKVWNWPWNPDLSDHVVHVFSSSVWNWAPGNSRLLAMYCGARNL